MTATLTDRIDFTWISWVRLSSDLGGAATYENGGAFDLKVGGHLTLSPSYYSYESFKGTTGHWVKSREPTLALTLSGQFRSCALSNRDRMEFVTSGDDSSWIYRIRAKADCPVAAVHSLTLFAWNEVFYYSQYDRWTRDRCAVGVELAPGKHWGLDLFGVHQADEKALPRQINGLGITLLLHW